VTAPRATRLWPVQSSASCSRPPQAGAAFGFRVGP